MRKHRKIPLRKCIASLEMFPKKNLVRVVRTPENNVIIDPTGKESGRGAYLCAKLEYIDLAQKKKALDHALKTQVKPDIYHQLKEYIKQVSRHE